MILEAPRNVMTVEDELERQPGVRPDLMAQYRKEQEDECLT